MRDGMLLPTRKALAPLLPLLLLLGVAVVVPRANSLPIQYLPEIPGYIPVYIRYGNQPLEEIHPSLAEAFHESSPGILKKIEKKIPLNDFRSLKTTKDLTERNDVSLDSKQENAKLPLQPNQLFYSLPEKKDSFAQKSKPSGRESVVMKIARPTYPEKVDVKKITKESKHKEGNK